MKVLNFGSLNLDTVFNVDHIVAPGETIDSSQANIFAGGKGLNQTIALARAGADVYHAGGIGEDGRMLLQIMEKDGVHCEHVRISGQNTGSAFIQVDVNGQNSIVLNGGANRTNTPDIIDEVLSDFEEGDILLLQNEINLIEMIIEKAYARKMFIILNPSPMNESILGCDLSKISMFIMNDTEGCQITEKKDPADILDTMMQRYPSAKVVLTLGKNGCLYRDSSESFRQNSIPVKVADTTGAGDTFTGYFITSMIDAMPVSDGLLLATKAASMAVMKKGAAGSIPYRKEVETAIL